MSEAGVCVVARGQAEGGDAGKRLLEALDRVFEPLEAGVMKLSAVSGATAAKEEDVLRGLFAVKVEAMQVTWRDRRCSSRWTTFARPPWHVTATTSHDRQTLMPLRRAARSLSMLMPLRFRSNFSSSLDSIRASFLGIFLTQIGARVQLSTIDK